MKIKHFRRPKIRIRRPRIRIRWRKKTSRWVIGSAVLFFIFLFVLQLVLMSYTKTILKNVLSMQVQQATNGLYMASFDDIEISYTQRNLIIHDLHLMPQDPGATESNNPTLHPANYDILIPETRINGINLRKAYLDQSIEIQNLSLIEPLIVLKVNFDAARDQHKRLSREDLHRLLPSSINDLFIKTINIQDARMELSALKDKQRSFLTASPLSLELVTFHINHDTIENADQIFFTNDFYLAADSVYGTLADSTYRFSLKALNASSADSSAFAQELILSPLRDIEDLARQTNMRNAYALDFQQLYMYGLSFNALYHDREFIVEEVNILNPLMKLHNLQPLSPGQKENFRIEDLYPAIDKVLNSVQVEQLNLSNGHLAIDEYKNGLRSKLSADVQKANISHFLLDSTASFNEEKILYSDKIDIVLHDYSMRLSDELHLLQADELNFSTESKEISARGFRLTHDSSSYKLAESKVLYHASVPLIHLQGVDMLTAYNKNNLNMQSLQLQEPTFTINRQEMDPVTPARKGKGFHEEDLYALVEDYLYTLNIDKISLQQGSFRLSKQQADKRDAFVTNIRKAGLWEFRLDSTSAYQMNKLFNADNFELEIENYAHDLPDKIHRITANEILISTLNDKIFIRDIVISSGRNKFPYRNLVDTEAKTLIDLQIPEIELQGVDILKAYLEKKLEVKKVRIPRPALQLGSLVGSGSERSDLIKSSALYDMMKDYLEFIQVEDLQLQDGELDLIFYAKNGPLTVSGRESNLQVENFRFDSLSAANPRRLFFADNVDLRIGQYETILPDKIHIIRAKDVMASTLQQEVHASNVELVTAKERYTDEELLVIYQQKGFVRLLVPEIKVTGINFDKAYYDEELFIDNVYASKPHVRYTFLPQSSIDKKQTKINLNQTDFYESMSPYLKVFGLNQLVVEEGQFSTAKQIANQQEDHLLLDGISVQMNDFFVDSSAVYDTKRFLYAKDISLQIERYRQELVDRLHVLSAQKMLLSTSKQHVKASNIELRPKETGLSQAMKKGPRNNLNRYYIALPSLQINGISFDEVYQHDRLHIQELLLEDPEFRVSHYIGQEKENDKKQQKHKNNTLRELIRGNLQAITVDTAHISKGHGEYLRYENSKRSRFQISHFTAAVQRFHLASGEEAPANGPFHADDIKLTIRDYERKLADSLHILSIDELEFSTAESQLSLHGMELKPRLGKDIRNSLKKVNKNQLYHIRFPLSQLQGVDLEQLQQNSLMVENLLIKDPSFELFRFTELGKDKKETLANASAWYQRLPDNLKLIQSEKISIEDGSFTLTSINAKDSSSFKVGNIRGIAHHFVLDSLSMKQEDKIFFADRLELQIQDYSTPLDNELYELKIKDLQFDSEKKSLFADSITLMPLVDKATFAQRKGYETDQFTLQNRRLTLENIDYKALINQGHFSADSLLLDGFNLHIYRDKRQPFPENHRPSMPQEIIRNMKLPFYLKGFEIRNGYIAYAERARGTPEEGFIDLTKVRVTSSTISNRPSLLDNGLTTYLTLDCYLMGSGYLETSFRIPLADTLNRHSYWGSLEPMSLPEFNPILEKTAFVQIRTGYANKINFSVEADKHSAAGIMEFRYQDLKVALVNKRTGKTGGPVKELGSMLANMFIINTHNIEEKDSPLRKGDMAYVRDENHSIVNYWVKTLVNGFKSSIGL